MQTGFGIINVSNNQTTLIDYGIIKPQAKDTLANRLLTIFNDVCDGLEKEGYEIEGEVGLSPINSVNVSGADAKQLLPLLEKLEENEDIQKVYSNFDLDESELGSLL